MTHDKHLWEFRWVRDLAIVLVAVLIAWAVYATRAITAPIVVGFGLAYVFNPLVKWAHEKHKLPRWAGAAGVIGAMLLVVAALMMFVMPKLVRQATNLIEKLHGYAMWGFNEARPYIKQASEKATAVAQDRLDQDIEQMLAELRNIDFSTIRDVLFQTLDVGIGAVGAVGHAIGVVTYLSLGSVIVAFCFFFFCWRFDEIVDWFKPLVPAAARERTFEVAGMMDECIAAIIRGRIIQSLVMGLVLSLGWWYIGVPYWLLLGMGCGLLNLIPYAAVFGCIVAVALAAIDPMAVIDPVASGEGFSWGYVIWPTVVYCVAQLLDGWVIEPLVQGQATDLDPLTVLLAVMIGGSLAGLLGMLLAIPVAACIKILAREVILPRWRQYAEDAT